MPEAAGEQSNLAHDSPMRHDPTAGAATALSEPRGLSRSSWQSRAKVTPCAKRPSSKINPVEARINHVTPVFVIPDRP
ncbi:hypothetical protein AAFF_G00374300 [Aldrovandia affinis]|uniref:Uncharacterized protein n=1 Tax=Aldrovandia affinis TaxID=143900 RepID=A0AAD7WMU4_9TELE|nr:hypothetical protein AAFF_G00374300 [Aldrovandia affinis]